MRHRIYGKHLGRDKDERDNLFKGLVQAIFRHGTIQTTEAKAKSIKGLVDRVINLAKSEQSSRASRTKKVYQFGLTKEILPSLSSRTSGYTSIVKLGTRSGDQAMMVRMSLIGAEEIKPVEKDIVKKKEELKKITAEKKASTGRSARKTTPRRRVTSRSSK